MLDFTPFLVDEDDHLVAQCLAAAKDKLHTLFPDAPVTLYDDVTLGIPTDSPSSETGFDVYRLGWLDDEIPAMQRERDEYVFTLRI